MLSDPNPRAPTALEKTTNEGTTVFQRAAQRGPMAARKTWRGEVESDLVPVAAELRDFWGAAFVCV